MREMGFRFHRIRAPRPFLPPVRGSRRDDRMAQVVWALRPTSGTGRLRKSTPRYAPRRELLGANGTARAKVLRWSLRLSSGQASRRSRTSTPGLRPSGDHRRSERRLPRDAVSCRPTDLRVDRPEGGPAADLVPSSRRRADPVRGPVRDVAALPGREGEDVHDHHDDSERAPGAGPQPDAGGPRGGGGRRLALRSPDAGFADGAAAAGAGGLSRRDAGLGAGELGQERRSRVPDRDRGAITSPPRGRPA